MDFEGVDEWPKEVRSAYTLMQPTLVRFHETGGESPEFGKIKGALDQVRNPEAHNFEKECRRMFEALFIYTRASQMTLWTSE